MHSKTIKKLIILLSIQVMHYFQINNQNLDIKFHLIFVKFI